MNSDPVWATVNWIHLSDAEALTIQRIGVRYRLHPLVVEDLVYRENRAKIDKYKTHMLITIPIMHYHEYNDSDYKFYFSNYTNKDNDKGGDSPIHILSSFYYINIDYLLELTIVINVILSLLLNRFNILSQLLI